MKPRAKVVENMMPLVVEEAVVVVPKMIVVSLWTGREEKSRCDVVFVKTVVLCFQGILSRSIDLC